MTPRGWRAPPELAEKVAVLARDTLKCAVCGADPGEPCTDPGPGRTVHGNRWVGGMIAYKRQFRASWLAYKNATTVTERTTRR